MTNLGSSLRGRVSTSLTPPRDDAAAPRLVIAGGIASAGLALCIALLYLGMRAVLDIGGACAEGGPYVPRQPCPDGVPLAMILGGFGLFGFGGLGMVVGWRIGGLTALLPILAWSALFGALGLSFLDYGLVNPPPGEGIVWGWLIPGVLFEAMAIVPLVFVVAGIRLAGSDVLRRGATASLAVIIGGLAGTVAGVLLFGSFTG